MPPAARNPIEDPRYADLLRGPRGGHRLVVRREKWYSDRRDYSRRVPLLPGLPATYPLKYPDPNKVVYIDGSGHQRLCSLTEWQSWAACATVLSTLPESPCAS